ncbi:MAG: DUF3826 domain-containing protein [Phycisphaerae bacterium]|nr:DUF3826 domain-containing protein [Phycisphaerae bacterium]
MKRLFFLTIMTAALTWPVLAQDAPTSRPSPRGPRGLAASSPASRPGPRPPRVELNALIDSLGLTPEQRTTVDGILAAHRQSVENFHKENAAKMQELERAARAARERKDDDALKAKQDELAKLFAARDALHEQLMKQLQDALSDEQMQRVRAAFDQMRQQPAMRALAGLAGLNLSDEQKQQAQAILDEANEHAKATPDPAEKDRIFRAAMEKIHADVLTADQREQAERNRHRMELFGMLRGLRLAPEQHERIRAIQQEMTKKLEAAQTPEDRRAIVDAAMNDVSANVLTKEQREQLDNFRRRSAPPPPPPTSQPASPPSSLDQLNLTDDQKKQIEKIRQDYANTIENANTPRERREAMRAAMKQIREEVLTEDQRKQLDELRPTTRPARG